MLVARGAPSGEVADMVAAEVGKLLDADSTIVARLDSDDSLAAVATWSERPEWVIPVGTRRPVGGHNAATIVLETGKPTRTDDVVDATGPIAELGASQGFRTAIAAPITVNGRVWGVMLVVSQQLGRFPPGAETRLAGFTDLVATALANADSRLSLATLAAEQDGLRRIATQVAQGLRPEQIFAAVTEEIAAITGFEAAVARFDQEGPSMVIEGVSVRNDVPIGTRWKLSDAKASAEVYRTGRPARMDSLDWSPDVGPVAEVGRRLGLVSQVAAPIIVEGSLWGAISLLGRSRLPDDAEQRIERFTELVATAIANAQSKYELAASRRRIVNAGDEARRRIERDLHDGIQQALIELTFRAQALARKEPDLVRLGAVDFADRLAAVSEELREVSRGIHPTILSEAGLGPALRALARRSSVPAAVELYVDGRLPDDIEAAAYYVASEALTNVAKHAQASVVELRATLEDGLLWLQVRDDGIGGVDPTRGSGVLGIKDRVEALGGSVSVNSEAGEGTSISVLLPSVTDSAGLRGPEEGDQS
jgi:signal transduction histidine kinase